MLVSSPSMEATVEVQETTTLTFYAGKQQLRCYPARKNLPRGPLLLFEPTRKSGEKVARDTGLQNLCMLTNGITRNNVVTNSAIPKSAGLCRMPLCPHTLPLGVYRATPLAHAD